MSDDRHSLPYFIEVQTINLKTGEVKTAKTMVRPSRRTMMMKFIAERIKKPCTVYITVFRGQREKTFIGPAAQIRHSENL